MSPLDLAHRKCSCSSSEFRASFPSPKGDAKFLWQGPAVEAHCTEEARKTFGIKMAKDYRDAGEFRKEEKWILSRLFVLK